MTSQPARGALVRIAAVLLLSVAAAPAARADEPPAVPPIVPPAGAPAVPGQAPAAKPVAPVAKLATFVQAKAALARFKTDFKTKDPEARLDAIDALAAVNHPLVIEQLVKLIEHRDPEVRSVAVQDLGLQRALADVAGRRLQALIDTKGVDPALVIDALEAIEILGWRGAKPLLGRLFRSDHEAIPRFALAAAGGMKDVRLLGPVIDLMIELKVDSGVRWEGGEVVLPNGTDAEAKAQYEAKYGNKARRGKSAARKMRSLGEILFATVKELTGQEFSAASAAKDWAQQHEAELQTKREALDAEQAHQEAVAKESLKAVKAEKAGG
jgi:hypothetical protein